MLSRIWKTPALLSFKEKITHLWGGRKYLLPLCPQCGCDQATHYKELFLLPFLARDTSHGAGSLWGDLFLPLPLQGSESSPLCSALGRDLYTGSLAAWSLNPIFSVVWGAKCYSQAPWAVTLLCSDRAVSTAVYQRKADHLLLSALHAPGA